MRLGGGVPEIKKICSIHSRRAPAPCDRHNSCRDTCPSSARWVSGCLEMVRRSEVEWAPPSIRSESTGGALFITRQTGSGFRVKPIGGYRHPSRLTPNYACTDQPSAVKSRLSRCGIRYQPRAARACVIDHGSSSMSYSKAVSGRSLVSGSGVTARSTTPGWTVCPRWRIRHTPAICSGLLPSFQASAVKGRGGYTRPQSRVRPRARPFASPHHG